jgi:hypothetical protein
VQKRCRLPCVGVKNGNPFVADMINRGKLVAILSLAEPSRRHSGLVELRDSGRSGNRKLQDDIPKKTGPGSTPLKQNL